MQLSVIIVNYNVKYFLEHCLYSVQKAIAGLKAEIILIDNGSVDNSIEYLQSKFPEARFVSNIENTGFARACNQGLREATGKYILFLNPDTIVPEDCFQKCIAFFESHADAGALGIKMLDGSGKFLKESKRSFPSPTTSLYKLFGLSGLFPRSKVFAKYHLGYLDKNANQEVDVLAGAFMMIKKEVLEKVGSFDEIFFMYGEDVDLSYRIQKAGYKNYYFADSSIIHFKGESTRKGSMNYVRMFYKAMSIFVRKHYSSGRARFFNFLIYLAIWTRAVLSAIGHFIRRIGLPMIDASLILVSFLLIKKAWNIYIRPDTEYQSKLLWIAFPAYTVFFLITSYYAGLYDRWYKRSDLLRSMLIAIIVLLAAYSLLPEQYRFSRGIILFGAILAFFLISLLRVILIGLNVLSSASEKHERANTIIAGTAAEYQHTIKLMKDAGLHERILGRLAIDEKDGSAIGYYGKLPVLSLTIPFKEIIFCEGELSFSDIIKSIQQLPESITIKIHASASSSIIGSDSRNTSGESVSNENGFKLNNPYDRRIKRLIDIFVSFACIITFPVHLPIVKKPFSFFVNCIAVLFAQKTWVGYAMEEKKLPMLRKGIIAANGIILPLKQQVGENLQMMDYWYARDYEPAKDIRILWRMYRSLGG